MGNMNDTACEEVEWCGPHLLQPHVGVREGKTYNNWIYIYITISMWAYENCTQDLIDHIDHLLLQYQDSSMPFNQLGNHASAILAHTMT